MEGKPQIVELNASELESLLDRIEVQLGAQTVRPLRLLLASYLALMRMIESKTASIHRLRRMLFGAKTERPREVVGGGETTDRSADQQGAERPGRGDDQAQGESTGAAGRRQRRKPGHGRIPAAA